MDDRCAILVTSCDAYEDAWTPFFKLLIKNWKDIPYPVYLNTETRNYSIEGLNITTLHPECLNEKRGKPVSWSNRLKQVLNKIDSPYILFFLEDFFVQSSVRADIIQECICFFEQNPDAVMVDFYHDPANSEDIIFSEFSEIKHDLPWAINANCSFWRKSFLIDILRDENPWDFEANATARWLRTNYKIYVHRQEYPYVIDYLFDTINGKWSGILRGKWLNCVPAFFQENGIEVDFSIRGLIDPPDMRGRVREKNWFWHDVQRAVTNPKMMLHYLICTVNVGKDKARRFWRKYFNR